MSSFGSSYKLCVMLWSFVCVYLFSLQAFRESEEAKGRLVDSYELMLGFYGIQLTDRETGEVRRAENWRERFANLER